jgi:hypothetical protein
MSNINTMTFEITLKTGLKIVYKATYLIQVGATEAQIKKMLTLYPDYKSYSRIK